MCSSLTNHGYDTHLVVADGNGNEVFGEVRIHDVGRASGGRFNRMTETVNNVFKQAKLLNAELYHLHDPELMPIALKLKKLGKKVIFDAHEDLPLQVLSKPYLNRYVAKLISKMVGIYESYVCKRLDAVVTATPYIRNKFLKDNDNSIDINNFPLLNELSTLDTSNFSGRERCCYVGAITKVRGINEIISSLQLVDPKFKLDLGGRFSEPSLELLVKQQPGWNQVVDHGWQDRAGIQSILQKSFAGLVTLHPIINYLDALPVKMFEYMAAGIPVIASDIPLWREIIEESDCGVCVDPYSPKDIANAIEYLGNNLEVAKTMGENGRVAVLKKYNWSIEERKLVNLYRELLS